MKNIGFVLGLVSISAAALLAEKAIAGNFDVSEGLTCFKKIIGAVNYPPFLKKTTHENFDDEREIYYVMAGRPDFPDHTVLIFTKDKIYSAQVIPGVNSALAGRLESGLREIKGLPFQEKILVDHTMGGLGKFTFQYLTRDEVAELGKKGILSKHAPEVAAQELDRGQYAKASKFLKASMEPWWSNYQNGQSNWRQIMPAQIATSTDLNKVPETNLACRNVFPDSSSASACPGSAVSCGSVQAKTGQWPGAVDAGGSATDIDPSRSGSMDAK